MDFHTESITHMPRPLRTGTGPHGAPVSQLRQGKTLRVGLFVCMWAWQGLTVRMQLHMVENSLPHFGIRMPTESSPKVDRMSQYPINTELRSSGVIVMTTQM